MWMHEKTMQTRENQMKKTGFLSLLLSIVVLIVGLCACGEKPKDFYYVAIDTSKPTELTVGDTVDYTGYFIVADEDGKAVTVTEDMLDLSEADTSQAGTFTVTLSIGKVSRSITFTVVAKQGGSDDPTPSDMMGKQTYDPSAFDDQRLQDKLPSADFAIGLPSTGDYHALVIPVQFQGDTITQSQLDDLEIAFNGTEAQTGWESVSTYYRKTSYNKLNLTFDIQPVYQAKNTSGYYEKYQENVTSDGQTYTITGEEIILSEALAYYENKLDLTKYDTNGDEVIDAVYLIYSADVDYSADSFYWAYVTWYNDETQYDGLDAYYYLFAGFDFMYEKTAKGNQDYGVIDGMKVNAETFIHETGHLFGLDDYYDYDEESGGNEGLGGADMMDCNIGDHGVYSKIMLGWLTPSIVTETKTVTLSPSATAGSAILIPLDFDNSYFCEYLLIDLYAATGLNTVHSDDLYDGAECGVRIYHVASWANDPFNNDFGSFTDNNNSVTKNALIKLIEADGTKKFSNSDGVAAAGDLWKAGQSLSSKFPGYTRYDGKKLNFDITIGSVSATSATVTVTFKA